MQKKILVFGATGDTGKYFIDYFVRNNKCDDYKICAVGTRDTLFFQSIGVEYFKVDISDKTQFSVLPKNVYAVVHLAGAMPAKMKGYEPQRYIDVNITGTLNILNFCRDNGVDRILYAQSFGDIKEHAENNISLTPNMERRFSFTSDHTVYVLTKNFAVDLIENYHQMYGLKNFIFRLPTIYLWVPADTYYVDGIIKKMAYRILIDKACKGEDIEVWGDSSRLKDMIYVKDFCQMLYKALFVERETGFYNVGTGIGTSLLDQIKGMIQVFNPVGCQSKLIECPEKPNAPQYIMDITTAVDQLGYRPEYDYISMLKDFKKEMELNRF